MKKNELSEGASRRLISLYKKLADFAYYEFDDIYAERYSQKISLPASRSRKTDPFHQPLVSHEVCDDILDKKGTLCGDLAIVTICTGITPSELAISSSVYQTNDIIEIRRTDMLAKRKRVPINHICLESMIQVLSFIEDMRSQNKSYNYVVNKICEKTRVFKTGDIPFSRLARNTFCDKLLDNDATPVMINILLGTSARYGCRDQLTYFHPTENHLHKSVAGVTL